MPNYCYCGRSEMQPFCDGSHNVVPARKAVAEDSVPTPAPPPSEESATTTEAARPGLFRRLFRRT
jgi:CDGSH-type Zn-finger protein